MFTCWYAHARNSTTNVRRTLILLPHLLKSECWCEQPPSNDANIRCEQPPSIDANIRCEQHLATFKAVRLCAHVASWHTWPVGTACWRHAD
jgi:hypothetical protein